MEVTIFFFGGRVKSGGGKQRPLTLMEFVGAQRSWESSRSRLMV